MTSIAQADASPHATFEHPVSDGRLAVLDTPSRPGEDPLVLRRRLPAGDETTMHRHPGQDVDLVVDVGTAVVRTPARSFPLKGGESHAVPPGVAFAVQNPGSEAAEVRVTIDPGGNAAAFIETLWSLPASRFRADGAPDWRARLYAQHLHPDCCYAPTPPIPAQKVLGFVFAPTFEP